MDLDAITKQLAEKYDAAKDAEAELEAKRKRFFEAADEEIKNRETLARTTIKVPVADDVAEHIKKFHPGWRLVESSRTGDYWMVIIEEDPAYRKFFYANQTTGLVFQRTVTVRRDELDDDKLKKENPELWERITEPARVLKPSTEWAPEDLIAIMDFMVPGKWSVSLAAPRPAKEGEL